MKVKTKGNSSPRGKSRVFFSCHPSDMERSFNKLCDDFFSLSDPAIYYLENDEQENSEDIDFELRQMNLIVIPVSFKLLMERGFTMNVVVPLAKEEHIPILPIMLEQGLDSIYEKEENFGTIQYLTLYSNDATEISYEKKMKDYLEQVLTSDELAERVRNSFDAYVFLSYRKKDRIYANDLIHLIHSNPSCRDVAIWYDEYLTPGEAFDESIFDAMNKSDFFTLIVTPNLVNEKNYVQEEEYPRAIESQMSILPVEMENTNRELLEEKYPDIPRCVKIDDERRLLSSFIERLKKSVKTENDNDPEHIFLIGIAYLEGIDVEVDRKRGAQLIKDSADAGSITGMLKLSTMYRDGDGVDRDWRKYLDYLEKAISQLESDKADYNFIMEMKFFLANGLLELGEYDKALGIQKQVYEFRIRTLGEDHPDTLMSLHHIASITGSIGDFSKIS